MASKSKDKGDTKESSRTVEGLMSKEDGGDSSPTGMNGDLDDGPQLWIHTPEDEDNVNDEAEKKRMHNVWERRRKDKIKRWVSHIATLLPPVIQFQSKRDSTLEIMEKASVYIQEMQDKNEKLLMDKGGAQVDEIKKLRKELEDVKSQRDKYADMLKHAGISLLEDPSHWKYSRNQNKPDSTATTLDCESSSPYLSNGTTVVADSSSSKDEETHYKTKSRRKNLVSSHLEAKSNSLQHSNHSPAQGMSGSMLAPNFIANSGMPMMNSIFGGLGQQVIANQNLLMNPAFQNASIMQGMPNTGAQGGVIMHSGQGMFADKAGAVNNLGLLQLAMQDAGITPTAPSDGSHHTSPVESSSSGDVTQTSHSASSTEMSRSISVMHDEHTTSALQTLASVASNTQNATVGTAVPPASTAATVTLAQNSLGVTSTTSSVNSIMSLGPPGYTQIMQAGGMMMNVPVMPGQQQNTFNMLPNGAMGNLVLNQHGQIIMLNDQGIPVMAGIPNYQAAEEQLSKTNTEKSKSSKKQKTGVSGGSQQNLADLQDSAASHPPSVSCPSLVQGQPPGLGQGQSQQMVPGLQQMHHGQGQVAGNLTGQLAQAGGLGQQNQISGFPQQMNLMQGSGFQSIPMQGQPQGTISGGQQQQVNQNMLQTLMPGMVGQQPHASAAGPQISAGPVSAATQGVVPVSQAGNGNLLALNTVPSQPNQLPTALILPNGQIIPVVTNPQPLGGQQNAISSSVHMVPGQGPQIQLQQMPGQAGPGVLIDPNNPMSAQVVVGPSGVQLAPNQQQFQQQQHNLQQQQQQQLQQQMALMQQQMNMSLMMTSTGAQGTLSSSTTTVASTNLATSSSTPSCSVQSSVIPKVGNSASLNKSGTNSQKAGKNHQADLLVNESDVMKSVSVAGKSHTLSQSVDSVGLSTAPFGQTGMGSTVGLSASGMNPAMLQSGAVLNPAMGQTGPGVNASIGQNGTMFNQVVGQTGAAMNPVLSQTAPGVNPAMGQSGAILLNLPVNGQQMNVLVDPVTMQVLGTLPPPQQQQQQPTPSVPAPAPPPTPSNIPATTPLPKRSSKKGHRAICPKPKPGAAAEKDSSVSENLPQNDGAQTNWEAPNPSGTEASASGAKEQVSSGENNDNLTSTDPTDILAKAAESIFLASEISPPSGSFYNPANEDNPLHIDTSVGDGEEDVLGSPSKNVHSVQTSEAVKVAEFVKSSTECVTQPLPHVSVGSELQKGAAVTAVTKTHLDPAPVIPESVPSTPKKSKARSKSSSKDTSTSDNAKSGGKKSSSKKKKEPVPATEPDTIMSLPESITFSESQLSDVLDQVENFVASTVESPVKKSRKGKASDEEPSSKKRKRNSAKEKDVSVKKPKDAKSGSSSKLSVYDFQDSPPEVPSATPPKRTGGSGSSILHTTSDTASTHLLKPTSDVSKSVQKKSSTPDENIDVIENILSHLKREQEKASKLEQEGKTKSGSKKKKKSSKDKDKETIAIPPAAPPVCTSSSSPDNPTVVSQTVPVAQKTDLMENDVSSSMLSPPSNNSTQSADVVTAAISSSGMDSLMELAAPSPPLTAVPSIAVSSPTPITTSVLTPSPGLVQTSPMLVPSPELTIPSPPHSSSPGQLLIQSPEFQSVGLNQSPQSIQNSPSQSMLPSSVSGSSPASGSSTPRYQSNFESHLQQQSQPSVKLNHMSHVPTVKPHDQLFPHTPTSASQELRQQQLTPSVEQTNQNIKSPSHQNYLPSTQMNSISQLSTSPSHSNQKKQSMTHVPLHGSETNSIEPNPQMSAGGGLNDQMLRSHASPHQQTQLPQHSLSQMPQRSVSFQAGLNTSSAVPKSAPIPSPGRTNQETVQPRVENSNLTRLETTQPRNMGDNSGSITRIDRLDPTQNITMGDNSGNIPMMDTVQNRTRVDNSRTNSSACSNYQPPQSMPGFSNANSMLSPKEQSFGSPPQLSSTMKLTHLPASGHQPGKPAASIVTSDAVQRSRSGIFSAENFVEPSRNGSNHSQTHAGNMSRNSNNNYGRMNNSDPANDSFNFTSIGLNLTSNSAANNLPNNSSSSGSTPFSFSLTPVTATTTTATTSCSQARPSSGPSSQVGHHQFPFYPLHPSVSQPAGSSTTSNTSSDSQAGQPHPTVHMLGLGMDLRMENSSQNMRPGSKNQMSGQTSFGFGMGDMGGPESAMHDRLGIQDKGSANSFNSGGNQKRHSEIAPNRTVQSSQHMDTGSVQRPPPGNNPSNYFSPSFHSSSTSLNTPPLHHPPIQTQSSEGSQVNSRIADNSRINAKTRLPENPNIHQDNTRLQQDNSHMPEASRLVHMRPNFPSNFPGPAQSSMLFGSNRFENDVPFNRECSNPQQYQQSGNASSGKSVGPPQAKQKSASHSGHALGHPPSAPHNVNTNSARSHNSNPSMSSSQSSSHPVPQPQQQSTPQPQGRSTKSRKQSKKSSKQTFNMEMDTNLSHSIFDSNQGIPPYFQIPSLPPSPSRNLPNEGPFLPGNFFSSSGRPLSNASASIPKNSDLGTPFNSLFSPSRPQNGLGLNFQPTFGMNPGNPVNTSQMPPSGGLAVTPHMSNFSLGNLNFLSDVNVSQCDSLNISPIKFHTNPMLPHQPGGDPNCPLQHPHQGPGLYHNRGHPGQSPLMHNSMSINSLLGHNPHGFDTRAMGQPINSSVGPPFHGPGHPGTFAMPPLNFSMHEH
ncbi:serine-rich adhesin for platelets-like isoform X2 [Gigantopelta aegis]|uniref:serine-rich adhesin for platelets-like isoform X2 n=1 Tax=Gigantopelta aegis TaxID=1735272 RepID=UPI001B88C1E4|nr:serine-rich adhesin for platelets-like isoform X2 [Gigantopelta aegis]